MDERPTSANRRPRPSQLVAEDPGTKLEPRLNGNSGGAASTKQRSNPYLPTRTELLIASAYPALLLLGAAYSLIAPETRAARFDATDGAYQGSRGSTTSADPPSYFARKDNVVNILFVKRGWAWITLAFVVFLTTHPGAAATRRAGAVLRWAAVTAWWIGVTQWFFGPALIDRGFRWTGGKCEAVEAKVVEEGGLAGGAGAGEVVTAAACKAVGGRWRGGHDISGHVFMLVLGSAFLAQEIGWVIARWRRQRRGVSHREGEERAVVMPDGTVRSAAVEASLDEGAAGAHELGVGGKVVLGVMGLCLWMLLMTATYFHTWFEKLTGLLVALAALYSVYILPRWVPPLRKVLSLPGI